MAPSRLSPLHPSTHDWPWVTRLHFLRPIRLQVDALQLEFTVYNEHRPFKQLALTVPVEHYQQMTDVSDPQFYAEEYPDGGDPGNYVVIQHAPNEFSRIAHLRQNSLAVAVGMSVAHGDLLGVMSNSGHSTSPHLHHQLQAGPNWQTADALPHVYRNGPIMNHDRGWYFLA